MPHLPRLPHPNAGRSFDRVAKDQNGDPEYGFRGTGVDEEIVHIPTGQSNQDYWQPEVYLDPTNCDHRFFVTDVGKREIECSGCRLMTSFHAGVNFFEESGSATVRIAGKHWPVVPRL